MPEVNCLRCMSLLFDLDSCWVDGERSSFGECKKRRTQIRKAKRNCSTYHPVSPDQVPYFLVWQRKKLTHIAKTLDLIEELFKEIEEE